MENYFEIKNLKCSYNDGSKIVLEIDELNIPRGKVVFIVGQSGCGKSTILETLGLMNKTLVCEKDTKFTFIPSVASEMDFREIWNKKNADLSVIRKKYFSFIFQNTNLMSNFSIRENAVISQHIKSGNKRYAEVMRDVYKKKKEDGTYDTSEAENILKKNKIGTLSGGQKQRLAFVRAFLPNFSILFGDEPTGNLDPENADRLIEIICNEIRGTEKTAIIVSHTPELYNKYADIIIEIQRKERENGETYGLIDAKSVKINNKFKQI
jgi:lipoprotein-releasing system ATP-binding protein